MKMARVFRHVVLPAVVPTLFSIVAAMPVEVFGCRVRGLMAAAVALVGGLVALGSMVIGVRQRMGGDPEGGLWVLSSLILIIPAAVIVAMEL